MPKEAWVDVLDKRFQAVEKLNVKGEKPHIQRVKLEKEVAYPRNIFTESHAFITADESIDTRPTSVAAYQIEFTSPPRHPLGIAPWLGKIFNKAIAQPEKIGLMRIDFRTQPNLTETASNSIHLNMSIIADGKNLLDKRECTTVNVVPEAVERGQISDASELALCIGKEHMEYLKHSLYMFARAENDYKRFDSDAKAGPSSISMPQRKENSGFGTAMFRGGNRQTERLTSNARKNRDKGAFRFEFRVPCLGAAGHPNREAYPAQEAMAWEMMEAYMLMLSKGVNRWKERVEARERGEKVEPLEEEMLLPDPKDKEKSTWPASLKNSDAAWEVFSENNEVTKDWSVKVKNADGEDVYQDRLPIIHALSQQLNQINALDYAPRTLEKGPHVARLLESEAPIIRGGGKAKT